MNVNLLCLPSDCVCVWILAFEICYIRTGDCWWCHCSHRFAPIMSLLVITVAWNSASLVLISNKFLLLLHVWAVLAIKVQIEITKRYERLCTIQQIEHDMHHPSIDSKSPPSLPTVIYCAKLFVLLWVYLHQSVFFSADRLVAVCFRWLSTKCSVILCVNYRTVC